MTRPTDPITGPYLEFADLEREEHARIRQRREVAFGLSDSPPDGDGVGQEPQPLAGSDAPGKLPDLVGLSLSGGGIRSALFNDGFVEALSHRGFLRWVDYLASVSGGGYLAGHLIATSQQKVDQINADGGSGNGHLSRSESFHDDDRWRELGRDPQTGRIGPMVRLDQAGGYLSRRLGLYVRSIVTTLGSMLLFLGVSGICATVCALLWRTFDDDLFRQFYDLSGYNKFGEELLTAFLPSLVLFCLLILSGLVSGAIIASTHLSELCRARMSRNRDGNGSSVDLSEPVYTRNGKVLRVWQRVPKFLLPLFAISILVSSAIYLGNGKSDVFITGTEYHLQSIAQWIAILAGAAQLAAFLGRNQLVNSEQNSSSQWRRLFQNAFSWTVLLLGFFALVHLMGREGVSGFQKHRDPYLERGDVKSFEKLALIAGDFRDSLPTEHALADMDLEAIQTAENNFVMMRANVRPLKSWPFRRQNPTLLGGPFEPSGLPDDSPKYDLDSPIVGLNLLLLAYFDRFPDALVGADPAVPDLSSEDTTTDKFKPKDLWTLLWGNIERTFAARRAFSEEFSEEVLLDPRFTKFLLARPPFSEMNVQTPTNENLNIRVLEPFDNLAWWIIARILRPEPKAGPLWPAKSQAVLEVLRSRAGIVESDRWAIVRTLHRIQPGRQPQHPLRLDEQLDLVLTNRVLLEVAYPGTLQPLRERSTLLMMRPDQVSRLAWLEAWGLMFLVGLLMNLNYNARASVYHYYRECLSRLFLRGWRPHPALPDPALPDASHRHIGERPLASLHPEHVGMPLPLYIASVQQRTNDGTGNISLSSDAFLLSPIACGNAALGFCRSEYYPIPGCTDSVRLSDAVALSGSAFAPAATHNVPLGLLMEMLGLRLGQWLCPPAVAAENARTEGQRWLFIRKFGRFSLMHLLAMWHSQWLSRTAAGEAKNLDRLKLVPVHDGGYQDYLGIQSLIARRCKLIVVTDASVNRGPDELASLAKMITDAATRHGASVLDLDDETEPDFRRLQRPASLKESLNSVAAHHDSPQAILAARIRYAPERNPAANQPPGAPAAQSHEKEGTEGLLFYVQMAISDNDPLEIRQIRNRFPSFPGEPTSNQFYTPDQADGYRRLGYHLGMKLCRLLPHWTHQEIADAEHRLIDLPGKGGQDGKKSPEQPSYGIPGDASLPPSRKATDQTRGNHDLRHLPLLPLVTDRLRCGYIRTSYEETGYNNNDVTSDTSEAVEFPLFPSFRRTAQRIFSRPLEPDQCLEAIGQWITAYQSDGDVRAAYRWVIRRTLIPHNRFQFSFPLFGQLVSVACRPSQSEQYDAMLAAHIAVLALACHEYFQEVPGPVCLIGGRSRLEHLMWELARDLPVTSPPSNESAQPEQPSINDGSQVIVDALYMLSRDIFVSENFLGAAAWSTASLLHLHPCKLAFRVEPVWQSEAELKEDFDELAGIREIEFRKAKLRHVGLEIPHQFHEFDHSAFMKQLAADLKFGRYGNVRRRCNIRTLPRRY